MPDRYGTGNRNRLTFTYSQTRAHQMTIAPQRPPALLEKGPALKETLVKMGFAAEPRTAETSPGTPMSKQTAATTPTVQATSILYPSFPIYFCRTGDGDQFVFDVFTVLGQQMERTLVWLDEADEETTVTCCGENAGEERKKCGGPNAPSCKTICGAGSPTKYIFPYPDCFPLQ